MLKILNVCGARPNFMKVAPLMEAYRRHRHLAPRLIHTGQHYDDNMSGLFFQELGLPRPDINLGCGGGSHAAQTAEIMTRFEPIVLAERPDWVVVVGDVNSTLACALVSAKLGIRVAHVEAGLRSFDRTMPEEINRVLTDAISDLLFASEPSGQANLAREGHPPDRVHCVGNVMIDTLLRHLPRARQCPVHARLNVAKGEYAVMTAHRPANVDHRPVLAGIVQAVRALQERMPVVFCLHPRTRQRAEQFGLLEALGHLAGVRLTEPLGYLEFLHLLAEAKVILTDSGGIQEEATVLRVPCLTLRDNTERPVTLTHGTNRLVGHEPGRILAGLDHLDELIQRGAEPPPLWDGRAAERIAAILAGQDAAPPV